jgi:hypothetical protein
LLRVKNRLDFLIPLPGANVIPPEFSRRRRIAREDELEKESVNISQVFSQAWALFVAAIKPEVVQPLATILQPLLLNACRRAAAGHVTHAHCVWSSLEVLFQSHAGSIVEPIWNEWGQVF